MTMKRKSSLTTIAEVSRPIHSRWLLRTSDGRDAPQEPATKEDIHATWEFLRDDYQRLLTGEADPVDEKGFDAVARVVASIKAGPQTYAINTDPPMASEWMRLGKTGCDACGVDRCVYWGPDPRDASVCLCVSCRAAVKAGVLPTPEATRKRVTAPEKQPLAEDDIGQWAAGDVRFRGGSDQLGFANVARARKAAAQNSPHRTCCCECGCTAKEPNGWHIAYPEAKKSAASDCWAYSNTHGRFYLVCGACAASQRESHCCTGRYGGDKGAGVDSANE